MALFDTSEEAVAEALELEKKADAIKVASEREQIRLSGRYQCLLSTIGEIEHDKTTHFITSGAWSMHDFVKYVIGRIGPAKLDAFTFAWGPAATRELGRMCETGEIQQIRIAINTVMKRWCTPALMKMKDYGQVVLVPMHAKGFTLENAEWKVSCIGSANFSNNMTVEGGVLCTRPDIFEFHHRWLDHLFTTGDEFIVDKVLDKITPPQPPATSDKVLFLVRGLPGAGKTTLAHHIADVVFENDDYFGFGDQYKFSQEMLPWAKSECFMHCREAMEKGVPKIAIANTFIDEGGLEPYYQLAKIFGYTVFCFVTENRTGNFNIHGVTDRTIQNMKKRIRVRL